MTLTFRQAKKFVVENLKPYEIPMVPIPSRINKVDVYKIYNGPFKHDTIEANGIQLELMPSPGDKTLAIFREDRYGRPVIYVAKDFTKISKTTKRERVSRRQWQRGKEVFIQEVERYASR